MRRLRSLGKRCALAALIVALVAAGGMAYYAYVYEQDSYQAEATVYVAPSPNEQGQTLPVDTLLTDSRAFLRDPSLIASAEARMRPTTFTGDRLSARITGEVGSRAVTLIVGGEDARACQRAANALGEAYCEYLVAVGAAVKADVTQKAELPITPAGLHKLMKIGLTFVITFAAVFLLLLLIPRKKTLDSRDALPDSDLPVLGRVADFRKDLSAYFSKKRPYRSTLYGLTGKPVIEDVRALSISLGYAARGARMKSVVVCSTQPDEGKSTLCVLLGSELAYEDKSVLLIDMDFYAPSLGKLLGLRCRADLIDLLLGKATIEQTLMETPIQGLYLIGNRHSGASATQLTSSAAFTAFLNHAYEQFDVVLFDTPPIGLYADALALGGMMDATVLVIGDRQLSPRQFKESVAKLRGAGAKLRGAAFTFVRHKKEKLYRDYEEGSVSYPQNE